MKCPECGSKNVVHARGVLLNETEKPIMDTIPAKCLDCGHEGEAHVFGFPDVEPCPRDHEDGCSREVLNTTGY